MLRSVSSVLACLLAFLFSPLFADAQKSFTVGTASAAPGEKATGYLEVPAGIDAATNIPVVVINGAKPGPVLALVTGAHGTEYVSIIAVEKLIGELDPTTISGTVILIPLVNVASFEQKVPHVNPIDNKSMNRFYPGRADGTQTERASFLITNQVVDRCDYLIDYHGGDLDESLRPYAYWGPTGNGAQDRMSKEMVLAFGLDHIIIWRDRPTDPGATRYLDNTASMRGKPSIVVEAGYAGTVEAEDVSLLVNGTFSTMRALRMLPGEPHLVENPVWLEKVVDVSSDVEGVFYPLVKRGTYVEAGMKLGYVTDFFGKVISEPRAPNAGVILHLDAVPSLKKGDNIANIGVLSSPPGPVIIQKQQLSSKPSLHAGPGHHRHAGALTFSRVVQPPRFSFWVTCERRNQVVISDYATLIGRLPVHYHAESARETRNLDQYNCHKPRVVPLGRPL